jgi:hypothetical protein
MQISAWSEFNNLVNSNDNTQSNKNDKNELAEWFVENKIIEHLYGPNLHVEVC